jgi:hypothetical protein
MPKRARQAHIPKQITRKRKTARREVVATAPESYFDVSGPINTAGIASDPVAPIPIPSAPARARPAPPIVPIAAVRPGTMRAAGQLPAFERAYLVDELRRIGITAGALLGLIIFLAFVLR